MPVVKHISIKSSPLDLLKYITGESKDECAALVSGLNCSKDALSAYEEMGLIYESCTNQKFSDKPTGKGKQKIKMHHYIQSFKANEISPEKAHELAVKWAEKVFGADRQIVVATHTDTNNIHNHIAVNSYDFNGVHWIDNKATLQICRDESDRLAKEYGASVIRRSKVCNNKTRTEYLAHKQGVSWKYDLRTTIDNLVLREDVQSIEDFVRELKKSGYVVRQRKYLSVKPINFENAKPIRTFRLGNGYGLEDIEYRIKNKEKPISIEKISEYEGSGVTVGLYLRHRERLLYDRSYCYRKIDIQYRELCKTAELLQIVCGNKLHSEDDIKNYFGNISSECASIIDKYNELSNNIKLCKNLARHYRRFNELRHKSPMLADDVEELVKYRPAIHLLGYEKVDDLDKIKAEIEKMQTKLETMKPSYDEARERKNNTESYYTLFEEIIKSDYDKTLQFVRKELDEYNAVQNEAERKRALEAERRKREAENLRRQEIKKAAPNKNRSGGAR